VRDSSVESLKDSVASGKMANIAGATGASFKDRSKQISQLVAKFGISELDPRA